MQNDIDCYWIFFADKPISTKTFNLGDVHNSQKRSKRDRKPNVYVFKAYYHVHDQQIIVR